MNKDKIEITTYPSVSIQKDTAENLVNKILELVKKNESSLLLLSGGSVVNVYSEMSEMFPKEVNLSGLVVGLIDERNVEADSPESNENKIFKSGLITTLKEQGANFIGILLNHIDEKNKREDFIEVRSNQYKCLFLESESVLGIFGVGSDGHTAGILPMNDGSKFHELFQAENYLVSYAVDPEDSSNKHVDRITLSVTAIEKIDNVVLYAKGDTKLKPLYQFVENDPIKTNLFPVKSLRNIQGNIEIITDQEIV